MLWAGTITIGGKTSDSQFSSRRNVGRDSKPSEPQSQLIKIESHLVGLSISPIGCGDFDLASKLSCSCKLNQIN